MAGEIEIEVDPVYHTLAEAPVAPGSLVITWPVGIDQTGTATDNGAGVIAGDAQGYINYGTGELEFVPQLLPVAESEYSFAYDQYTPQVHSASGVSFTLPDPPKPGTLSLEVPVDIGGHLHTYVMRDNGSGNMSAPGFSATLSQSRLSLRDSHSFGSSSGTSATGYVTKYDSSSGEDEDFALDDEERTVTWIAGGISGTVDYVTGLVTLDLSTATARKVTVASRALAKGHESSYIDITGRN